MAFDTAANILNDAAVELGLYAADAADPYDSSNANSILLCRLLKSAGQGLLRIYPWTHLQARHTFSTVDATPSYALPADFARITDGTAWNTSTQLPMNGPLGPQAWEAEKARSGTSSHQFFRIWGNLFHIHATPSSAETIAYEYTSRYWVDAGGGSTPDTETPTDGLDTLFFDRRLLVTELKLLYARARGRDTTSLQRERDEAFAMATGADGAAPVLRFGGAVGRLVDWQNLPDTGYGS